MRTRPVIFISDFGPHSPYVGHVHLVIERLSGGRVTVIDGAHDVPKFDVFAGAYVLYSMYRYAPRGSVFLVVVDPGVGSEREAIAVKTQNFYLVGPNNGVLWPVIEEDGLEKAVKLDNDAFWLKPTSYTFHGRDIFAPAATMLSLGVEIEALGSVLAPERLARLHLRSVKRRDGLYCMRVVFIDEFGNVTLSSTRSDKLLERVCTQGAARLYVGGEEYRVRCVNTFSEVPEGCLAVYYNSFDFIEVAVFMDSAAKRLGVKRGDEICIGALEEH